MNDIITSNGERITYSISNNGNWVFIRNFKNHEIRTIEDCYYLLPLIELDRNRLIEQLEKVKTNIKPTIKPVFLYRMILKFSLKSKTHWGNKAILQLNSSDIDYDFEQILYKLIQEKQYDQKSRHILLKLISNR